jgi:hypothetical protein
VNALPPQSVYEFANMISHLVVAAENPGKVGKEIEKAERHMTRCLLDYVKYRAIKAFQDGDKSYDHMVAIIRARLKEANNVGTDHNDTLTLYEQLLDKLFGLRPEEYVMQSSSFPLSATMNKNMFKLLKGFVVLEAIHSGLHCEKYSWPLKNLIDSFVSGEDFFELMQFTVERLSNEICGTILMTYEDQILEKANLLGLEGALRKAREEVAIAVSSRPLCAMLVQIMKN